MILLCFEVCVNSPGTFASRISAIGTFPTICRGPGMIGEFVRWGRRCGIREFTVPVAGCRVPRRKPPLTLTRSGKPSPRTAPVRSAISSCCATSGWTWAEIRHCPCRPIGVAPPWQGGAAGASEGLRRATIHQIANESLPAVVRSPRLPKLPRADNDLASNCPEFCKFLDRQRSRKRVIPVDAIINPESRIR